MLERDDKEGPSESDLPSLEQLKSSVQAAPVDATRYERQFQEDFRVKSLHAETGYAHLKGLIDHYKHKSRWSYFLMFLMFIMVLFQSVLMGCVGAGKWDFTKYEWLLPALLVQNLAQIVGLAVFVVKALFRDMKWPPTE